MPSATVDPNALYAAVDQKRLGAGVSWRELASQLQISPSTFTRMAQGRRPDVDTFATLLRWLNMSADRFVRASGSAGEEEPMSVISSYLRSAKNIRPEDAEALEDIIQAAYRRLVRNPDG
jgi:transcriptional regulator with XRE-family HTH domain